ncbi:hypothetical protein SCNRRL3882_5600 [Streptomyces chartreusis NRRL 3882]|uniref:Uncharacterized protein n=1 Tax=Streptomyces chartreusis NRRL 3882 TaxID=1079985 RepID=A0A2N9BFI8_STRCX|nr:hypothetical protein [Streptomyces sp. SID5464]SOR82148.1 hypothetical protein SCNRRL3882_5600 [Streptomyces chartreusis NRRL 3882]
MNSSLQRAPRPAVRRWHVVCVLGLLAGLLGMHGLAPGGGLPQQEHMLQTRTQQTHVQAVAYGHGQSGPHGSEAQDGHCGGGHVQHADATCASGAVGGGPVLPSLVADPVSRCGPEDVVRACAVVEPDGARAPPSLAELQLLRI